MRREKQGVDRNFEDKSIESISSLLQEDPKEDRRNTAGNKKESGPCIRAVQKCDLEEIYKLCVAHAAFEQLAFTQMDQEVRWSNDFFSSPPRLFGLIAICDSKIVAYATYMKQYATWNAAEYMYLDCLFVTEKYRCQGIGEMLMKQVKRDARKHGCDLVQWQTPTFNKRAMKFYRRLGAESKGKKRFFLNL